MTSAYRHSAAMLLLAVVGCMVGCGGGGSAYVTQFPDWEFERYERLAVLPVKTGDPQAVSSARRLTDHLETMLANSGAFTVLSRAELEDIFREQDLSNLVDVVDEDTALPAGQVEVAQAIVKARITDFQLIDEQTREKIPVYRVDKRGRPLLDRAGRPIISGYKTVVIYEHGAVVEGSVRVVDAATGRILVSDTARFEAGPKKRRNRRPSESPQEMATEAAHQLAVRFAKRIAPTRVKVELDSDMLIVAEGEFFDGKYDEMKKVPRSRDVFTLVVRNLPPECDGNVFRVGISAEDGRRNVVEEEFVWSGNLGARGLTFEVPVRLLIEEGGEKFRAKLYSGRGEEPILERDFELVTQKDD